MPELKPVSNSKANIKVVGVGGGGCNVINTMISLQQIQGVDFIAVNTDEQALNKNQALIKLAIGKNITGGLGAGAKPDIGEKAALESEEDIRNCLDGADMVFISAGMGGGTGTGAAPVIAKIAKNLGALTIGVVTKPFSFEGKRRSENAEFGIDRMRAEVDALIVVPNEKLLEYAKEELTMEEALNVSDSVLSQGVQGISDLIVVPGEINVDFADVETVMKNAGTAMMGIGIGVGDNRAEMAAKSAISSPLLDTKIEGAKGVLVNIVGGSDMKMSEYAKAAKIITDEVSSDANIIFGYIKHADDNGQIKITVIATDFENSSYTYAPSKNNISSYNTRPASYDRYDMPKVSRSTYDEDTLEPTLEPELNNSNFIDETDDYEETVRRNTRENFNNSPRNDFSSDNKKDTFRSDLSNIRKDSFISKMDEDAKSLNNLIEEEESVYPMGNMNNTTNSNANLGNTPSGNRVNNPFLRNQSSNQGTGKFNSGNNQSNVQGGMNQNSNSYESKEEEENDYLIPPFLRRKK